MNDRLEILITGTIDKILVENVWIGLSSQNLLGDDKISLEASVSQAVQG